MRLRLELFVADLDVSIAFYERVPGRPWGLRDFRIVDPDGSYWRVTERAP